MLVKSLPTLVKNILFPPIMLGKIWFCPTMVTWCSFVNCDWSLVLGRNALQKTRWPMSGFLQSLWIGVFKIYWRRLKVGNYIIKYIILLGITLSLSVCKAETAIETYDDLSATATTQPGKLKTVKLTGCGGRAHRR